MYLFVLFDYFVIFQFCVLVVLSLYQFGNFICGGIVGGRSRMGIEQKKKEIGSFLCSVLSCVLWWRFQWKKFKKRVIKKDFLQIYKYKLEKLHCLVRGGAVNRRNSADVLSWIQWLLLETTWWFCFRTEVPPTPEHHFQPRAEQGDTATSVFFFLKHVQTAVLPQALKGMIASQDWSNSMEPLLIFSPPP